jgi:hypothetical protein
MAWKFVQYFTPSAVVLTLLCGLVYAVGQQNLRQGANDPQIELVRNMELALRAGTVVPADYASDQLVDIRYSLSPFVMIFDQESQLLVSTGQLDGESLSVPDGVLDYMNDHWEEHTITLQPTPKVRLAAVFKTVPLNKPGLQTVTVMSARSLQVVEEREQQVLLFAAGVWGVGMVILVVWSAGRLYLKQRGW